MRFAGVSQKPPPTTAAAATSNLDSARLRLQLLPEPLPFTSTSMSLSMCVCVFCCLALFSSYALPLVAQIAARLAARPQQLAPVAHALCVSCENHN